MQTEQRLSIVVLYGSYREARVGIRAALFVERQLKNAGHQIFMADAMQQKLPFLDKMRKEFSEGEAPPEIESLGKKLELADAFVLVSGEYNHGVPAGLKNMLDHYQREFYFKPVGIATYSSGSFGGVRAAVHLRAVTAELGMVSIPSQFPVPKVGHEFDEEGNTANERFYKSFDRFQRELSWYAEALRSKRKTGTPY